MNALQSATRGWLGAAALLALTWAALIALLEPSGSSMLAVWGSSGTYTHGYVIPPLALWLAWRKRHALLAIPAGPDAWALAAVLALALMWLAGRLVGAQVVEHYALVGSLIAAAWALLGRGMVRVLLFPLAYLLLMVPSGDSLIAPMINFTADFTVTAVRLWGIPVYREGTFFVLPTGEWSVVEACSGIRYFLSSIVLGTLYAYLSYRALWKRLAFCAASVIVPVLANGVRATLIVLIGHYSGMTMAVGVDHLIYGWVWFGIVMLILFWLGNFWREDGQAAPTPAPAGAPRPAHAMAALVVGLVALFPLYERHLGDRPPAASPLAALAAGGAWRETALPLADWQPHWVGMDDRRVLQFTRGAERVMLFAAWYGAQRQGAELINSQNVLIPEKHPVWRKQEETGRQVELGGRVLDVRQARMYAPDSGQRLLVWQWFRIAGRDDTNIFRAKLRLAGLKLLNGADAGAGVILAAPYAEHPAEAEAVLKRFLIEMGPRIRAALDGLGARP